MEVKLVICLTRFIRVLHPQAYMSRKEVFSEKSSCLEETPRSHLEEAEMSRATWKRLKSLGWLKKTLPTWWTTFHLWSSLQVSSCPDLLPTQAVVSLHVAKRLLVISALVRNLPPIFLQTTRIKYWSTKRNFEFILTWVFVSLFWVKTFVHATPVAVPHNNTHQKKLRHKITINK